MNIGPALDVALTLNANLAPIELVLDMADTMVDTGLMTDLYRHLFVINATRALRLSIEHIDRQIARNIGGSA